MNYSDYKKTLGTNLESKIKEMANPTNKQASKSLKKPKSTTVLPAFAGYIGQLKNYANPILDRWGSVRRSFFAYLKSHGRYDELGYFLAHEGTHRLHYESFMIKHHLKIMPKRARIKPSNKRGI